MRAPRAAARTLRARERFLATTAWRNPCRSFAHLPMRWAFPLAVSMTILCATSLAGAEPHVVDYFVDQTGRRIEFKPVYEGWFGDRRYPPNYGRAVGEN